MTRRLAAWFASHPVANVLAVLALFGGLGVMDGVRILGARDVMDTPAWTMAVAAGPLLAPLILALLRLALVREVGDRSRGGGTTILVGFFGWLVLFGTTHPRGDDQLDEPWRITGVLVADLLLVMFVTWASWNHLARRPSAEGRSDAGQHRADEEPRPVD